MAFYIIMSIMTFIFWVLVCNHITYVQRNKIIDKCVENWRMDFERNPTVTPNVHFYFRHYHQVSYLEHMFYLITFRNPKKLYPYHLEEKKKKAERAEYARYLRLKKKYEEE